MSTKTNPEPTATRAPSVRKARKASSARKSAPEQMNMEKGDTSLPDTTPDAPSETTPPKKTVRRPRRKTAEKAVELETGAEVATAEKAPRKRTRRTKVEKLETPVEAVVENTANTTEDKEPAAKSARRSTRRKTVSAETSADENVTETSARKKTPKAASKTKPARQISARKSPAKKQEEVAASSVATDAGTTEAAAEAAHNTQDHPTQETVFIQPPRPRFTLRKQLKTAPAPSAPKSEPAKKLEKVELHPAQPEPIRTPMVSETEIVVGTEEKAPIEAVKPFSALGLSSPLLKAIQEMGYETPTPIQAQAIPEVLAGRDVMGVAQTGTGKTASFTLPMLEKLSHGRARARMPRALILEPTRELALQVAENFEKYGKHLNLTHALLIGGSSMNEQRDLLNRGVDVLIATPGRLLDMFSRGGLLLMQTDLLVIDEADRMLDMGFIPDIEKIVHLLPPRRQTMFFSATMAPEIRKLADAFLKSPKEIEIARPSSVATTITERVYSVARRDKPRALRKLLDAPEVQNAIVFCNRKRDVDTLHADLSRKGISVGHLHGDLSQPLRFSTLEKFRNGELKILVCSDVAARGIDIGGLSHVVNYDLPFNAEDYVHRIGRTGRAGKEGHAFSLMTPDELSLLEAVEKLTEKDIERGQIAGVPEAPLEIVAEDAKTDVTPEIVVETDKERVQPEPRPVRDEAPAHNKSENKRRDGRKPRHERSERPERMERFEQTERKSRHHRVEHVEAREDERPEPEFEKTERETRHQRVWNESPAEATLPLLKNGFLPPVPEKDADLPGFGMEEPDFMRIVYIPAAHGFIEE